MYLTRVSCDKLVIYLFCNRSPLYKHCIKEKGIVIKLHINAELHINTKLFFSILLALFSIKSILIMVLVHTRELDNGALLFNLNIPIYYLIKS